MTNISFTEFSFLTIISISAITLLSMAYDAWRLEITPTPSSPLARRQVIQICSEVLSTRIDRKVVIYELGCGWGGLLYDLSKQYQTQKSNQAYKHIKENLMGIRAYELALIPYLWTKLRLIRYQKGLPHGAIHLLRDDCLKAFEEVRAGDILFCYLCPGQMRRIATFLRLKELPLEICLISLTFALPGYEPSEQKRVRNIYNDPIYIYHL